MAHRAAIHSWSSHSHDGRNSRRARLQHLPYLERGGQPGDDVGIGCAQSVLFVENPPVSAWTANDRSYLGWHRDHSHRVVTEKRVAASAAQTARTPPLP